MSGMVRAIGGGVTVEQLLSEALEMSKSQNWTGVLIVGFDSEHSYFPAYSDQVTLSNVAVASAALQADFARCDQERR